LLDDRIEQRFQTLMKTKDAEIKKQLSELRLDISKLSARIETFENIFPQVVKIEKDN